jgi:tetratricopeptide (TPR) repeat protein
MNGNMFKIGFMARFIDSRQWLMVLATVLFLIMDRSFLFAQETDRVKQELFQPIESALQQARNEEVPTFAPTLFAKANQYCRQAELDYRKGERLNEIRERLGQAMESLNKAVEVANVSKAALAKIHETRMQVAEFEFIRNLAPKKFAQAERDFREAILKAEKGDINGARKKAESAQTSYREATVEALQKSPIKQAEAQLKQAKKTLSREVYNKAQQELTTLKNTLRKAKKQEFEISALVTEILDKISEIKTVKPIADRLRPRTEKPTLAKSPPTPTEVNRSTLGSRVTSKYEIKEFGETGIDAAMSLKPKEKNYFFKGNAYSRLSDTYADSNYPKAFPGEWSGLPEFWKSGIDAAIYHESKGKAYLFKGDEYIRLTETKVDPGYPRRLPGEWQGLPASWKSGIDAALYYEPNGKVYFFKGNQYARLTGTKVDNDYPKNLPGGWQGLPVSWYSGIDAAIFRKGHTYFFREDEYIRFTGTKADNGYPRKLPGGWVFQNITHRNEHIAEGDWIVTSEAPFNEDLKSGFCFPLKNTFIQKWMGYGEREYGINLVWYDPSEGHDFFFKKSGGDEHEVIRYGDLVAIKPCRGGGWITYKEREYGINLGWSDTPEYEWEIKGGPIGQVVRTGDKFDLYNQVRKDRMIYCERSYGINLKWASECDEREPSKNKGPFTTTVWLNGQPLGDTGYRPYVGSWGPVSGAHMIGINVPEHPLETLAIRFVKPGNTTDDCGDPASYVEIIDGNSATPDQIEEIYGTSTPGGYVPFVACVGVSPWREIDSVIITITYVVE